MTSSLDWSERGRAGPGAVLAVLGATGGSGASSFAAALAACRPGGADRSTLLDLDPAGGGVDVLLGLDGQVGARWSDLRLGGGVLDPVALHGRLPSSAGVGVLACDAGADPSERDVEQVLAAARQLGPVVLDLPRWLPAAGRRALRQVDTAVVLVPGDVRGVVAGSGLLGVLSTLGVQSIPLIRPGMLPNADAAQAVGARTGDVLPVDSWFRGDDAGRLDLAAIPRPIAALAARLWAHVEARR